MAMALSSIILLAIICRGSMATIAPDPKEFFSEKIHGNLTKITWAHAVNNKTELSKALSNDTIMMLEADISLGTITGRSKDIIPIMAHPPHTTSDLSLEDFLNATLESGTRGIKLDFKSIEAFNASLPILTAKRENMTIPLFLNADILRGPHGENDEPVDADEFLEKAKEYFPESKLSLGWKTQFGILKSNFSGSYTQQQIQEMVDVISKNNITQSVTYAVRAGLAVHDINIMEELLNKTADNNATLTIWSANGDFVDSKKLKELITKIGEERCYVDVPQGLWDETEGNSAGKIIVNSLMIFAVTMISSLSILNFI